jgi:hypothetical protein
MTSSVRTKVARSSGLPLTPVVSRAALWPRRLEPQHYCRIDLHARTMYVCILDAAGTVLVHKDMAGAPEAFLTSA